MAQFREISPKDMKDNMFTRIGEDWMLLCAGTPADCNAMTCSWGQAGIMWNKPVVNVFVRPQRHTKGYVEKSDRFTLSFFEPGCYRNELNLMGTKSGRDGNKIAEAGLHVQAFGGEPAFEEANLVLVCKKLYQQDLLEECFLDKGADTAYYPQKDYHRLYVGEVEHVFVRE